jgi:prepilin peptidase CpaA
MEMTAEEAWWFLPAVIPIALYVSWTDLSQMKITNKAVMALIIAFAILGFFALPFETYLWRWSHLVVMLLVGILLNAAGVMGAGDAKFIAAASPMLAVEDLLLIIMLAAASLLGGFATHRLAKHSPLRKQVPHWASWEAGKRFPMGFPLSMTLLFYLLLMVIYR